MGCNYYLHQPPSNRCDHCGREDEGEVLHIGKSSGGWVFALHVLPERGIHDLPDWLPLWDTGEIRDEYGEVLSKEAMLARITERRGAEWDMRGWWGYLCEADFHEKNHSLRGPHGLLRHQLGHRCVKHGEGTWDCMPGEFS